jgi:hypothetical protein
VRGFRAIVAVAFGLALLLGLADAVLAQCPMCRTALESPEGRQLAGAFNRAILFLLSVPFTLVGTVALLIARSRRVHGLDDGAPGPSDEAGE